MRIRGVDLLTPREGEVLELLQEGATNARDRAQLSIGVETVRTHARNIYRKLGIASTARAGPPGAPGPVAVDEAARALG